MNEKGEVTIIEVLVAMAILGILASIVVALISPDFEKKVDKRKICEERKMDCRVECTELNEADEMRMCLEKCDIKFDKCNLN